MWVIRIIIRSVGHPKLYLFVGKKVVSNELWVIVGKETCN